MKLTLSQLQYPIDMFLPKEGILCYGRVIAQAVLDAEAAAEKAYMGTHAPLSGMRTETAEKAAQKASEYPWDALMADALRGVYSQREEILRAFMAKYNNLQPEEVEQVETRSSDGAVQSWSVRKKRSAEKPKSQRTFQMSDEELSAFQMTIPPTNKQRFEALEKQLADLREEIPTRLDTVATRLVNQVVAVCDRVKTLEEEDKMQRTVNGEVGKRLKELDKRTANDRLIPRDLQEEVWVHRATERFAALEKHVHYVAGQPVPLGQITTGPKEA